MGVWNIAHRGGAGLQPENTLAAFRDATLFKVAYAWGLRRRELVMTARGKIGLWMKLIAPGIIDRIVVRAVGRGR